MTNEYIEKFQRPHLPNLHDRNPEWLDRHMSAVVSPRPGHEQALVQLLSGWLRYADEHKRRYQSGIGSDGVLGVYWAKIGGALLGLLNGETGRFDCGLLDALIRKVIQLEGFEPSDL